MREVAQGKTSFQKQLSSRDLSINTNLAKSKVVPVVTVRLSNGNLLLSAPRADTKHAVSHMPITPLSRTLLHPLTTLDFGTPFLLYYVHRLLI